MAVWELLKALELEDSQKVAYKVLSEHSTPEGARLLKVKLPQSDPKNPFPRGIAFITHEIGRFYDQQKLSWSGARSETRTFYFVYNPEGQLIGILPILPKPWIEGNRYKAFYMDLTPYYFNVPRIGDQNAAKKWAAFSIRWRKDKSLLESTLPFIYEAHGKTGLSSEPQFMDEPVQDGYYTKFGTIESIAKGAAPYGYVECPVQEPLNPKKIAPKKLMGFSPEEFKPRNFKLKPGKHQIIFPVFPTVYAPWRQWEVDKLYYSASYPSWVNLPIRPTDKILVIGPGSGIDTWFAWLRLGGKVYARGINPLEVANTKATAKIAGFPVEATIGNHLKNYDKNPFHGVKTFDYVYWGMPSYGNDDPERPSGRLWEKWGIMYWDRGLYRSSWDGDPKGRILKAFLAELKNYLGATGKAVLWNFRDTRAMFPFFDDDDWDDTTSAPDVVRDIIENHDWNVDVYPYNHTAVYIVGKRVEEEQNKNMKKASAIEPLPEPNAIAESL